MPVPLPEWNPWDRAAPLKEECQQYYQAVIQYHYHAQGYLAHYPDLLAQLPDLPAALDAFTDKGAIVAYTSDLCAHLVEVHYLYGQGDLMTMIHEQSVIDVARPVGSRLKAALPTAYDGTSSKAHTFLMECWTFIWLNWSSFPNNQVKILWALQLCSDKAANWKQIQTELLEMGVDVPNHLLDWDAFQKEFLLKWVDLNMQDKAWAKFASGLKQTTSVHHYAELFKETVLEADFTDPVILTAAFYEGLKGEIKQLLIRRWPKVLANLKLLTISLDKEHMGAECCESKPNPNCNATEPNWQVTMQVKAEVAQVRMTLSANNHARYVAKAMEVSRNSLGSLIEE